MRVPKCFFLLVCLLVCGGCGKKSTAELIEELKSDKEPERVAAVRTLQKRTGDAGQVVPALIETLKNNKDGEMRRDAANGLGYFGEQARDAIPALEAAASDADIRVREAARRALSRIDATQFPGTSKPGGK